MSAVLKLDPVVEHQVAAAFSKLQKHLKILYDIKVDSKSWILDFRDSPNQRRKVCPVSAQQAPREQLTVEDARVRAGWPQKPFDSVCDRNARHTVGVYRLHSHLYDKRVRMSFNEFVYTSEEPRQHDVITTHEH